MPSEHATYAGGATPLTAAQLNTLLGQLRRQGRLRGLFPVAVDENGDGFTVRLESGLGFWLQVTEPAGAGRYAYQEVVPDGAGTWQIVAGGRTGVAAEANARSDIPVSTVAWAPIGRDGRADASAPVAFCGPAAVVDDAPLPEPFWAMIAGSAAGTYGYVEQEFVGDEWRPIQEGRQATADTSTAAVEVNGVTDLDDDTVVLAYDPSPSDAVAATSGRVLFALPREGGFWARLGDVASPLVQQLSLAAGDSAPVDGTWRLVGMPVGQTALDFDATALEVQEAAESIPGVGFGNIRVASAGVGADDDDASGGPYLVTFQGALVGDVTSGLAVEPENLVYATDDGDTRAGTADDVSIIYISGGISLAWDASNHSDGYPWTEVTADAAGRWVTRVDGQSSGTQAQPALSQSVAMPINNPLLTAQWPVRSGDVVFLEPVQTDSVPPPALGVTADGTNLVGGTVRLDDASAPVLSSTATGGTFTLTCAALVTPALPFDATAAQVQQALEDLADTSVDPPTQPLLGLVTASGGPLPGLSVVLHQADVASVHFAWQPTAGAPLAGSWSDPTSTGPPRAVTLSLDDPVNAVQTLALYQPGASAGRPLGGTFTLALAGAATTDLDWDAPWQDVQAALEALPDFGPGTVACSGGPLPARVVIEFIGSQGGKPQPLLTADVTDLEVADDDQPAQAWLVQPLAQTISLAGVTTQDSQFVLQWGAPPTTTSVLDALTATAGVVQTALAAFFGDNVVVTGPVGGPWLVRFVNTLLSNDVALLAGLGVPTAPAPTSGVVVTVTSAVATGTAGKPTGGTYRLAFGPTLVDLGVDYTDFGTIGLFLDGLGSAVLPADASSAALTRAFSALLGTTDLVVQVNWNPNNGFLLINSAGAEQITAHVLSPFTGANVGLAVTSWTAPLPYDATAATVQAALATIPEGGAVCVAGPAGGPFTFTAPGYSGADTRAVLHLASSLVGGLARLNDTSGSISRWRYEEAGGLLAAPALGFWATITSLDNPADLMYSVNNQPQPNYSWAERYPALTLPRVGRSNATEINGNTCVPAGAVVWLVPTSMNNNAGGFEFAYPVPQVMCPNAPPAAAPPLLAAPAPAPAVPAVVMLHTIDGRHVTLVDGRVVAVA